MIKPNDQILSYTSENNGSAIAKDYHPYFRSIFDSSHRFIEFDQNHSHSVEFLVKEP